ncbi:MAG: energy transducer TonB [Planctomycetota bacterium]
MHVAVFTVGWGGVSDAAAKVDLQPGASSLAVTFKPPAPASAGPAVPAPAAELPPLPETPRIAPAEPDPVAATIPAAPAPAGELVVGADAAPADAGGDAGAPSAVAVGGQAPPVYPRQSRMRGEEGVVQIMVSVSAEGRCIDLQLTASSGFERLDGAAMDWARRVRFEPARRDGRPVAARLRLRVPFELRRKGTP